MRQFFILVLVALLVSLSGCALTRSTVPQTFYGGAIVFQVEDSAVPIVERLLLLQKIRIRGQNMGAQDSGDDIEVPLLDWVDANNDLTITYKEARSAELSMTENFTEKLGDFK